jgi:hypothetical protein
MACFKETNQECPPFCPPFLTVFVPLVKYRAAADKWTRLARLMNRFNKGKSLKAGTFVITISVALIRRLNIAELAGIDVNEGQFKGWKKAMANRRSRGPLTFTLLRVQPFPNTS